MGSEADPDGDRDIASILRSAGRRATPSDDVTRSIRLAVEAEWRAAVGKRPGRARLGWSIAACVALVCVGIWQYRQGSPSSGERMADVSIEIGSVHSKDGWLERWQPVQRYEAIRTGTELATGSDGRAALVLEDQVSLRLDHDTRIALTDLHHVRIESGAVYVDSQGAPQPDIERLQIMSPAGAVRHVGTQYEVRVAGAGVQIAVREGRIELNTAVATHRAQAGERLTVSSTGSVQRQSLSREDASWDWVAATAPAFEIEGRPLSQFLTWAARELGADVVYANAASEAEASRVLLSGSIVGLSPAEALTAVLPTTSLSVERREGQLVISPR